MPEVLAVGLIGSATAVATGLGAIPVWLLGRRTDVLGAALNGLAAGVMAVAAVVGLLIPAHQEGSPTQVAAGAAAGVAFLLLARRLLTRRDVHVGKLRGASLRRAVLTFAVLLVHSLPEGLALGTAFASTREGLALFVFLAIAVQNVPEGTATAIPMEEAGFGRPTQLAAAVLTSMPQPAGAIVAYLLVDGMSSLLPLSLAFAGGAMLALVVSELAPAAWTRGGLAGAVAGAAGMLALSIALGA